MGGTDAYELVRGIADVDKAYSQAVHDARMEHGHGGYSGTIAESGGYRVFSRTPVASSEAHRIAAERIDAGHLQKWEAFEAIAVATDDSFKERTITKELRLDVPQLPYHDELQKLVAPLLGLKEGELIKRLDVKSNEATWKPVVKVPDGDRRVVYRIEGVRGAENEEFESIAAARARLTDIAKRWGVPRTHPFTGKPDFVPDEHRRPLEARIYGVVDRGWNETFSEPDWDGKRWPRKDRVPMVEVTTEIKSRKVTVEATLIRPNGTPKFGGWLFYGIASC